MTFKFYPLCAAPLIERAVQGEMRRVYSADCGFVHYDNPNECKLAQQHRSRTA